MEKLKPIHKHELTNIIKVGMFALMLLLPFLVFLPNAFYYGFNEHAVAQEKQIETKENILVDFNQLSYDETRTSTTSSTSVYTLSINTEASIVSHKYLVKFDLTTDYTKTQRVRVRYPFISSEYILNSDFTSLSFIGTATSTQDLGLQLTEVNTAGVSFIYSNIQYFDLTKMYGEGNEPTINEFENTFPSDYYPFTESKTEEITITTGTETIIDIPYQMNYAWQTTWELPLFNWTSNSILNTGLNAFCNGLGIVSTSYISNFLTYELVIVAIYIVLDIVLTLFTWLTHMGQKE